MMIKMLNMMIFRREFTRKMPRTKTVDHTLRKPARSNCTWTCHKSHFAQKLQVKCRGPKPQTTLCANLRIRNALGHFTRATLCENFSVKCRGPRPRTTLCASLQCPNALGHCTSATSRENLPVKCRGPRPGTTLCASLRGRNDCMHKRNFCRNLHIKCQGCQQ